MEYKYLREEISSRIADRQKTVTVMGSVAALIVGFASKDSASQSWWIPLVAGGFLAVIACVTWLQNGRNIGELSSQLAQLEYDLNEAAEGAFAAKAILSWEGNQQCRTGIAKWAFGEGQKPSPRQDEDTQSTQA